jgi:hypothetical protein
MPPKAQSTLPFGKTTQSSSSNKRNSSAIDPEASEIDSQASINSTLPPPESNTPPETSETFEPLQKPPNKKTLHTSWVFKWMRGTDDMQYVFYNTAGKEEWRYRFCLQNYQISSGTGTIRAHLDIHNIKKESSTDTKAKNVQIAIEEAIESAAQNPQKRRRLNDSDSGEIPLDRDVLEVLYIKFITACNMPLRLVECPEFRALLSYLNSNID